MYFIAIDDWVPVYSYPSRDTGEVKSRLNRGQIIESLTGDRTNGWVSIGVDDLWIEKRYLRLLPDSEVREFRAMKHPDLQDRKSMIDKVIDFVKDMFS